MCAYLLPSSTKGKVLFLTPLHYDPLSLQDYDCCIISKLYDRVKGLNVRSVRTDESRKGVDEF